MSKKEPDRTRMEGTEPCLKDKDPGQEGSHGPSPTGLNRREFLGGVSGMTAATLAAGAIGLSPAAGTDGLDVIADDLGPLSPRRRRSRAYNVRVSAARQQRDVPLPDHPNNGDDDRYPNGIASYSKGLPHDLLGEVDQAAYDNLLRALSEGESVEFEQVSMPGVIKLKNPQAGLAYSLIGPDSHHLTVAPAPRFDSAETAAEMGELYWQALSRDVPFTDYESDPITNEAAGNLSMFSDFRGPKAGGVVTPGSLFRADIPGVPVGPFLSQFFLKNVPAGPQLIEQRINALRSVDYLTSYGDWLDAQNGNLSEVALNPGPAYDPIPRFIRNGRDLAEVVHWDWPAQAAINAMLVIFGLGGASAAEIFLIGTGVPYDLGNPYMVSESQGGFVTFQIVHITALLSIAMHAALTAAWYQKWYVHRRLRPEEFGGRVHNRLTQNSDYPVHPDLLNSSVLTEVNRRYRSYLMPQAFPEGAPCHPAYPSGHATWAGATATVLKAFFNEAAPVTDPVVASPDGLSLVRYTGPDADALTIGGELNKLAWNIAIGRNFAGIHWRTDATEGLRLGERVGLGILRDLRLTYNEPFEGFSLTTFDGESITV